MLSSAKRVGSRKSYAQTELIHTIRRCGLTSGLKLCLDAGDANSYSGSGQSWLDTSGNGYDFFLGATVGAEASDPTFNGTAGRRSSGEYWSFDGGDYFRYDSANETWMENLHKDNAIFTLFMWEWVPAGGGTYHRAFGTIGDAFTGIIFMVLDDPTSSSQVEVLSSGTTVMLARKSGQITTGAWHCHAVSCDEAVGANGGVMFLDGAASTFTSTYTSPSSSPASNTAEIGARGNGSNPIPNTSRLGMFAAWEGVALTQEQLNAIYMHTRGRFGV